MTFTSGLISDICRHRVAPLIFGIVMSVMTRSKFSGAAENFSRAFSGSVSATRAGRIMLTTPFKTSRISVSATTNPHPALFKSIGEALAGKYRGKDEIPVRLTGTLGRPGISIR